MVLRNSRRVEIVRLLADSRRFLKTPYKKLCGAFFLFFFCPSAKADGNEADGNESACNKFDGHYVLKGLYSLARWQRLGLECKKTNPTP